MNLKGRVALVTGSSRGIGRATAWRLAQEGADVVVNYVTSRQQADSIAEEIAALGRRVWVVKGDVRQTEDMESMMDYITQEIGQLDILISNAATGGFRSMSKVSLQHFRAAFETNVYPMILLVQKAVPLLQRSSWRGKVVGISSQGAHKALPWYGLVGASKAALEATVRHLALEFGEKVNFNIIRAGLVDTDSGRKLPHAETLFREAPNHACVGNRLLTPTDVANAIVFLVGPESDMIQGSVLTVDGGADIHP